jgi:hypothetical protein
MQETLHTWHEESEEVMRAHDRLKRRQCSVDARILVCFATLMSSVAEAGTWVSINEFWLYASLTGSQGDETVRVAPDTPISNPDGCSATDGYVMSSNLSADAQKRIYSILLAAQLGQRSVHVMVNGCHQNRPAIVNAALSP